jgi:hypothetical protein
MVRAELGLGFQVRAETIHVTHVYRVSWPGGGGPEFRALLWRARCGVIVIYTNASRSSATRPL